MNIADKKPRSTRTPYRLVLGSLALFTAVALFVDTPMEIAEGLWRIVTSRSILTTDYVALGGIGAALVNVSVVGAASVLLLRSVRLRANGLTLVGLFQMIGFAFVGKNIFNCAPIVLGVFLYTRFQKEPFLNYSVNALLATTMAPVVSQIAFSGWLPMPIILWVGILAGMAIGFVMPIITTAALKLHGGYTLYNAGVAGGIVALFLVAVAIAAGLEIERPMLWSTGNNLFFAAFLYILMFLWMLPALSDVIAPGLSALLSRLRGVRKPCEELVESDGNVGSAGSVGRLRIIAGLKCLFAQSGRLVSDYYMRFGKLVYLNMGLTGMLGVTVTLMLGAEINGATMAGIFSMMGFSAFGKHIKNCLPVMSGALIGAIFNQPPPTEPANIVPILFCTGLSPIAGRYGWVWGITAGFLHMALVHHLSAVTGGLSLYSNGFSAGFVALVLVPLILNTRKGKSLERS